MQELELNFPTGPDSNLLVSWVSAMMTLYIIDNLMRTSAIQRASIDYISTLQCAHVVQARTFLQYLHTRCTMDMSHLTRPGILCQCSGCSSSLAALENEWAKLSNAYSIPTAWLSVDLHRVSVSSERKQIPNTSDMTLLRGRVIQEVSCKLCKQRMGVLCPLDNG